MRGLIYPIRQSIFWLDRDGALFQSVINTSKEVELMQRGFWGPQKGLYFKKALRCLIEGRDMVTEGGSFKHSGDHATFLDLKEGWSPCDSYHLG